MTAAALASAHPGNRNLSSNPRRMAVINVILGQAGIRECGPFLINGDNVIWLIASRCAGQTSPSLSTH